MDQENMWKIIRDNNFEINDEINSDFLCAICHKILMNACNNAHCGCRYCNGCIKEYLKEERKPCPGESEYCDKNQFIDIGRDILIDQPINIKISKLLVKCQTCQSKIELKSMPNHTRMCVKQFLHCPYHDLGCKEKKLTNEEVVEHLSAEIHSHMRILMEWIIISHENSESLKKDVDQLRNDNNEQKEAIRLSEERSQVSKMELERQIENQNVEIDKLKNEMMTLINENKLLREEMKNIHQAHYLQFIAQLEQQSEEIIQLKQCKIDETQLDDKLKFQRKNIRDIDMKLGKILKPVDELQTQSNIAIQSIEEMQDFIQQMNYGEFVWKIDQWSEKRIHSKNGSISDIDSDSFFSHRNGYKICLRLYPDGNDTGKSTHLSIYFCIMKGPFDDILQWPFNCDVQISLINQQSGIDYATWIKKCSDYPGNESFFRPINEINEGYGNPKFIELEEISTNLELNKKNQIFIKCSINSCQSIQEILDITNHGELIWRIKNWSDKRKQAQNGSISAIYSNSFFSHRNGCKLCLCVYPDGNGTGKFTHLSIFFCIMKGPFDDILQWPFKHDVQISLINQQSGLDHSTLTIRYLDYPDNKSFMKPINEINYGHGNPKFIELEQIAINQELSRNNQIFIKCSVKPSN